MSIAILLVIDIQQEILTIKVDTENERIANDDDDLELKAVHMFYFLVTNKVKKPIKDLIKHIQGKHE